MNFPDFLRPHPLPGRVVKTFTFFFAVQERAKPLFYATFFLFLGECVYCTVFNLYLAGTLHLEYSTITFIFALSMLAAGVLSLPLGYVCDHIGRRFVLFVGFYFWVAGLVGQAMFPSLPLLYFFSMVHGVGLAAVWTAFAPMIADLTPPREHVQAFTANFLMMFLGSVAGNLTGGVVPYLSKMLFADSVDPYRFTMYFACFLLLPAHRFFSMLPEEHFSASSFRILKPGALERRRRLYITIELFLPYMLTGVAIGLTLPFINIFLRGVFDLTDQNIGFSLAAVTAMEGFFIVLVPYLAATVGRIALVSVALLAAVPFLAVVSHTSNSTLSILFLIIGAGLAQMSLPLQLSFAMRQYPSLMRGIVSAEMASVWYIANAVGALMSTGFVSNELSLTGRSYLPAAVLCGLGGGLYWLFWRKRNIVQRQTRDRIAEHFAFSHGPSSRFFPVDGAREDREDRKDEQD